MIRVLIIGAGQLGRRHLQALSHLEQPIAIGVVDPSDASVAAAMRVFDETRFADGSTLVTDVIPEPHVAIIATNARERAAMIGHALSAGARSLIMEKVLFTRLREYDQAERSFEDGVRVYVNCARRTYGSFPLLREITGGTAFSYRVVGAGWGLGCNVIHHLDEFAALAGTTDITLDASGLKPGTIPAKRAGYVEFLGTLRGHAATGATFEATCDDGPPGDRVVTVETGRARAVISQTGGTLTLQDGSGTRTIPIDIPLQSRITAEHVRRILAGGTPDLPDYQTAAALHRPMIAAFLGHLRRSSGDMTIDECPIT